MRTIFVACAAGFLSVSAVHALRDRSAPAPASLPLAAAAIADPVRGPVAVALQADRGGQFHVDAVVDGRSLPMMVDTGATLCAFSEEDAARIGLTVAPGDYTRETRTANGVVRVAPVRIGSLRIGSITVRDVEAVVIPRGRLGTNLLGMSFLKRLRDFSVAGGTITLRG